MTNAPRKPIALLNLIDYVTEKYAIGQNEQGYEITCIPPQSWLAVKKHVLELDAGWASYTVQPNKDEVGTGCECPNCANGMGECHTEEQKHMAWAMAYIEKMLETVPAHSLLASQVFHSLRSELK